jgi:nucleotide-binding universal stress UspA family protein
MDTGEANDAIASQRIGLRLKSMRLLASCEPAIRIRTGEFVPAVAATAVDLGADLVVLDSSPLKVAMAPIAANAGELAAQVGRPVLVVRRSSLSPYESVLIAADQPAAFTQLLRMLSSWRLLEGRPVVILHGLESPYRGPLYTAGFDRRASSRNAEEWERAARRRLQQGLAAGMAAERFRYLFVQSRPLREVQREIRRLAPELLAIATRHHPAVDRVMRASTGNDLLRNIECDVVAVPMKTS